MSYSFSARGETKADVMKAVVVALDNVVADQPIHAADRAQAQAAVEAFLDIVPIADGKDVSVSVSGYVSWSGLAGEADQVLTSANVNVSVSLVAKA